MSGTDVLHLRVPVNDLKQFRKEAAERYHRDPNDLLRELIKAAAEGRVKIIPTEGQTNQIKELYDESGK